jgi:hypothetical protein
MVGEGSLSELSESASCSRELFSCGFFPFFFVSVSKVFSHVFLLTMGNKTPMEGVTEHRAFLLQIQPVIVESRMQSFRCDS